LINNTFLSLELDYLKPELPKPGNKVGPAANDVPPLLGGEGRGEGEPFLKLTF
jgi:hypothetical protein